MANYFRLNLAGDLSGTMPLATVVKIQSTPVSSAAPVANGVLAYNGSTWLPSITPTVTNLVDGYATTATAASTTTLTSTSARQQYFTGTSTQTVKLPQTSTLALGQTYRIVNRSTGAVSVQTFTAAALVTIPANTMYEFTVVNTASDASTSWAFVLGASTNATGVTGLSASRMLYSDASGVLTATAAPTNGQLLIGSTGAIPALSTLTAGTGMSITNGAGSITLVNNGVTSNAAGTGISVSGSTGAVTIANTGVVSAASGTGVSVSASTGAVTFTNTGVLSNVAGTGIGLSGSTGAVTITNTGVTGLSAGSNITISASTGVVTISSNGPISSIAAGTGISVSGSVGAVTITNSGVTSFLTSLSGLTPSSSTTGAVTLAGTLGSASGGTGTTVAPSAGQLLVGQTGGTYVPFTITSGTGISTTTGSGTFQINNTGVTSITGGTGISASASTGAVTLTNTGVTSAVGGTGVSVSSSTGAVTFTNTGVTGISAGANITISGSTGVVTINGSAGGVTSLAAGTGISVSGSTGAVTVTNTGVTSFQTSLSGLTPSSASSGAVTLAGTLGTTSGGTGRTAFGVGDIPYGNTTSALDSVAYPSIGFLPMDSGYVLAAIATLTVPSWRLYSAGVQANSIMNRDSNGNTRANNLIEALSTVATAAGTTTLTSASNKIQYFTGSTTQTVRLPDVSSIGSGGQFLIINTSSGALTIQTSAAAAITTVSANTTVTFTITDGTNNVPASWNFTPGTSIVAGTGVSVSSSTGAVTITNTGVTSITGTANQITASASTGAVTLSLPAAVTIATSLTVTAHTANSFLYSGPGDVLTTTAAPTNGQILIGATGASPTLVSLGGDVTMANSTGAVTVRSVNLLPINATTGANSSIYFGYSSTLPTGTQAIGIGYQSLNVATGTRNTALGVTTGTTVSSGTNNTLIGYNSGASVTTLSNNTLIGSGANSTVAGAVALGFGISANQTGGFFVTHRGPLSVTTNVAGFIAGTNELVELSSSRRYKTNIRDLEEHSGEKFDKLRPVRYNPMEGHGDVGTEHIGLIAEELDELWPEFISKDAAGVVSGITYDRMVAVLIKEVQSLRKRMAAMESQR